MAARIDPDVAAQKMRDRGLEPLEPYPGAAQRWRVRCMVCGSESAPKWAKVQSRGDGCSACGKKRTADAKRVDPMEAAAFMRSQGYEPLEPFHEGKSPWRCIHLECGREVTPQYTNMKSGQGGRIECGKANAASSRRGNNSDAAIAFMREHQLEPLEEYPGGKCPWLCRCTRCGSETTTNLDTVRAGNVGCIPCGRRARGLKRRLPAKDARTIMNRVGLTPAGTYPGTSKPWPCTCNVCGTQTKLSIASASRRLGKSPDNPAQGCEACVFASLGRHRMLSQIEAEQRMADLGMQPVGEYRGVFEPWHAICLKCGAENQVLLGKAHHRGRACNACSIKSRNDSYRKPEDAAVALMLAAGFTPLEPYISTRTPWRCLHLACGQEVSPRLSSIQKGTGCAYCAKYGFDEASPAILYVIESEALRAVKVGITGIDKTRLPYMTGKRGWTLITELRFDRGRDAHRVETAVLRWWRDDLGAPIAVTPQDMGRRGGWSETAALVHVSSQETVEYALQMKAALVRAELSKPSV